MDKKRVILVTDGDKRARKAVETAAGNIGGRCISLSGGNPTILSGQAIAELIKQTPHDPVVVMVDDKGAKGVGRGERAMEVLFEDQSIDVIGVVAVSSHGKDCVRVDEAASVTKAGKVVESTVDKYGNNIHSSKVCGDTLSILRGRKDLIIVGLGDPGKMDFRDEVYKGAPITTKALKEVIKRSMN